MNPRSKQSQAREPVDWAGVHAELAENAARIAGRGKSPRDVTAILLQRAEAVARPAVVATERSDALEVVVFELSGQAFAVEACYAREAVLPRDMTRLPGLPGFVRGVVNVRSRIVAAMDLRPLLQLPGAPVTDEKLLIVDYEGSEFGVLVERMVGLQSLAGTLRRDVPGLNDQYLQGIAADGTLVLRLSTLVPDLVVNDGPQT